MDIEEVKDEVVSTFNDRMRNPFVFTFIISWLAWNWLLVYEFFSFPKTYTLEDKTKVINDYIQTHLFCNLTTTPLVSSLGVSLVYLLFSFGFTYLFNFYNTTVKAKIFNWTAKGKNIPRDVYDSLYRRHNRLKVNFDNSKKLWHQVEEENISNSGKLTKLRSEKKTLQSDFERSQTELDQVKKENRDLQTKYDDMQVFYKKERNEFERIFLNRKTWYVWGQTGKEDFKQTEKIKFDENDLIKDAATGIVKYEIKEIRFSKEDKIISFRQFDYNNSEEMKVVYLFDVGFGVFKGIEKDRHGNPVRSIIYTQDKKNLENFKLL
jgi:hypothetical protein